MPQSGAQVFQTEHLLNWASPCRDPARASCVRVAHELPTCGPHGLPMSCTPSTQDLGEMTHPRGGKLPTTCAYRRRKCACMRARCATTHPSPADLLGVLINTGLRAQRRALPRAAARQTTGAADPLRRGCPRAACKLRANCTGDAHQSCAGDAQLPRGTPSKSTQ